MFVFKRSLFLSPLLLLSSAVLVAQQVEIPLHNWTVPAFTRSSSGGIHTMTDVTAAAVFVGITPCRLVDTRQAGFPAGYGPPSLAQGVPRDFGLNSDPQCTGFPAGIAAYSLNITVTNTQGPGFIKIYPQGGSVPFDVSTLNYVGGQTIANAAIVPAGIDGGITVVAGVSGTDLVIDINGYFSAYFLNAEVGLTLQANNAISGTIQAFNINTGASYGIYARSSSLANNSAGIRANNGGGSGVPGVFTSAGVRGETTGSAFGVLGLTTAGTGTGGFHLSGAGAIQSGAELGYTAAIGGHVLGNLEATGMKPFVEPHPSDASKIIRYVALEGNEAGTYFRGKGKFQNGIAVIEVPEDFRIVTDSEGLSIQVTPIRDMATVAVQSIGLDRIVVKASRNVEFFYLVNGIRRAYKDVGPIAENEKQFVPRSPDEPMPVYLPQVLRERLISNGTYRPDGTVNMETAHRLGWDKVWEQRSSPAAQPAQP